MTVAVLCLTAGGYGVALKLKQALEGRGDEALIYTPDREFAVGGGTIIFDRLSRAVEQVFSRHRRIVFIMALGIVVRVIAPHIRDKTTDPAVVVLDEAGRHVISVLSGHLGGANELARLIAALTGARAVITTATDVLGLPALDELARAYNLVMDPPSAARLINGALVNGRSVCFYATGDLLAQISGTGAPTRPMEHYFDGAGQSDYRVLVTNRLIETRDADTVYLRPRNLVAGVGCRRGMPRDAVLRAITRALQLCGRSPLSLRCLATIDIKGQEPGLVGAAGQFKVPLAVFTPAEINNYMAAAGHNLSRSAFVQQTVGVPAVCEPAALLASRKGELILTKQKFTGVTVAIAEDR